MTLPGKVLLAGPSCAVALRVLTSCLGMTASHGLYCLSP